MFKKFLNLKSFRIKVFDNTLLVMKSIFRKEIKVYFYILPFILFIFIFVGQMISVVGSKQILEPVIISAVNISGQEIKDFKRFMQLSRAGNYNLILFNKPNTKENPWKVEGVFIKKLLVGMNKEDVLKVSNLEILIGEKKFVFSGEELLKNWKVFDKEIIMSDLNDVPTQEYVVFEVPDNVYSSKSKIPFYKDFFSNIINWSGDNKLFLEPALNAIKQTIVALILLLIFRVIFLLIQNRDVSIIYNDKEIETKKINYVSYIIILFLSLFLFFGASLLVYVLYHPDMSLVFKEIHDTYLSNFYKNFRPKPIERMQFMTSVILSPFLVSAVYFFVKSKVNFISRHINIFYPVVFWGGLLTLFFWFYFGLALSGFYFISDSIFSFNNIKYLFLFLILPLSLYRIYGEHTTNNLIKNILKFIVYFSFIIIFFINVLPLTADFSPLTFDPVIYPVSQVFAGKSMLVNLSSLYGLFSFYLTPIFQLIGLSVYTFTLVLALLVCVSLFFVFKFMRLVVKNDFIFYTGFLFVVFYTLLATRMVPELYYQYWPIRYFFPCISLMLSAIYLKKPNPILYYLSFFVYGVAVLWNFDVGIIVFLTWILTLIYNDIAYFVGVKEFLYKAIKHAIFSFLGLFLAVTSFMFLTWLKSGFVPDVLLMFQFQKMFLSGYFMIKLVSVPHIWSFVLFIYLVGLTVSLSAVYKKNVIYIHKIVFLLVSTGLGLFVYYEGQASDVTLFRVWYPALILLVLFADYLYSNISSRKNVVYGEHFMFSLIFIMLISAPFSIFLNLNKYAHFTKYNFFTNHKKDNPYYINIDFLKSLTKPKEEVLILAEFKQGIYYAETNTKSVVDVASVPDIFFPKEMDSLIKFLNENKDIKVFVEFPLEKHDKYDLRIKRTILNRYNAIEKSEAGMVMYLPNK